MPVITIVVAMPATTTIRRTEKRRKRGQTTQFMTAPTPAMIENHTRY
jgi:hypothetical protein